MDRRIFFAALVATPALTAAVPARAATIYDGNWSVLIITDRGSCDRAYRYGVTIDNGIVNYRGDGSFDLQGRVNRAGRVQVTIASGDQQARGSGRLSRDSGAGVWSGSGPTGSCGGRWTAERRSR